MSRNEDLKLQVRRAFEFFKEAGLPEKEALNKAKEQVLFSRLVGRLSRIALQLSEGQVERLASDLVGHAFELVQLLEQLPPESRADLADDWLELVLELGFLN